IAALENYSSDEVRENAAEALGKIGDERAVKPLIKALNCYNYHRVCEKAAEALEKIGDGAIGPLLAALKDDEGDVRLGIPIILGQIGGTRTVEPLIAALKDDYYQKRDKKYVWEEVAKALVKFGDAAVEPLIAALKDRNHAWRAACVLGQL